MRYLPAELPRTDGSGETADSVPVYSARIAVASTSGFKGYDLEELKGLINPESFEDAAKLIDRLQLPMLAAMTAGQVFLEWQLARARDGKPRMTGLVGPAIGVFSWQEGDDYAGMIEPNAVLSISSQPELTPAITSLEEFREAVGDLAQALGTSFDQVRVYVLETAETLRILQRNAGAEAPTAGGEGR